MMATKRKPRRRRRTVKRRTIIEKLPPALLQWMIGVMFAMMATMLGFVVKLSFDVACAKTQVESLNGQMHDVAEMVGKLWMTRK